MDAPAPARPRLRVTLNPIDPAACAAAAREDRMYDADRYDHDAEPEE